MFVERACCAREEAEVAEQDGYREGGERPHSVREIPHVWITLADGCRLSARIWLPQDADERPVPAILEYLPYRKDDHTAWQDSTRHPYFAQRGYAAVRVDIRGTGDSDGILLDEYLLQEQRDAIAVIAWLAEQSWCSGSVGMIGYSWGGFNGLQIAAHRPPALKAVVSLYSTDDRYADDCHYLGGAVLGADMLPWAHTMRAINALPPTPEVVGECWRDMWRERLEDTPHFVEAWLSHQRRDAFWQQGSIAENYSAVQCPVFAVGGWADAYTNAVPRMLEHLSCPRAGLIGPWAHIFPERGVPGPAIGFLQECVAWFDRWLKGEANGVDEWPLLRVWLQEPVEPASFYPERPGRWLAIREWPSPAVENAEYHLSTDRRMGPAAYSTDEPDKAIEHAGIQSVGVTAGAWCANGLVDELPVDQRDDDARSLCFDTEPLDGRLELLGRPEALLDISVSTAAANVAARLCDVAPDGASRLLTYGVLNLTHRESHENPSAVEPGTRYRVSLKLNVLGEAIEAGHRLRLALSPTYWPMVWPVPEPVTLRVHAAGSRLMLPILDSGLALPWEAGFGPAEHAEPLEMIGSDVKGRTRSVTHHEGLTTIAAREQSDSTIAESAVRVREDTLNEWAIRDNDPLSAHVRCERDYGLEREGWRIRILAAATMTATERAFRVSEHLQAFEGDVSVYETERRYDIPRDFA
jgi:putative CocE/NonD family hydrolase